MLKELLTIAGVLCLTTSASIAAESVQAYAHPTLFGSEGHTLVTTDSNVVVGGKFFKPCKIKTIEGKNNVIIGRHARKMLADMKNLMDKRRENLYDPKMPVLRSEVAYLISNGLGLTKETSGEYTDLTSNYWAKSEIEKVLTQDIMIGYPDSTFKPDKVINKAEVFCTFAKLMNVEADKSAAPLYNGKSLKYVPAWAYGATNEVIASGVLAYLPDQEKILNDEYLSKEQVAFFVSAMKNNFRIDLSNGAVGCATKAEPVAVKVKLSERMSARTSNVGETFTAETLSEVNYAGKVFPAGSYVEGEIASVVRPGLKNPGFIEVRFTKIKNGKDEAKLPGRIVDAKTTVEKNPNVVSRVLAAPFSVVGRTAGVAGRTVSEAAEIIANGTEEFLGNWSDSFSDTASLHPLKGAKSVGSSVITVGKGVYNILKLTASGVFGVGYELYDEAKYIFVPNTTNDASLNPDEELVIMF